MAPAKNVVSVKIIVFSAKRWKRHSKPSSEYYSAENFILAALCSAVCHQPRGSRCKNVVSAAPWLQGAAPRFHPQM